MGQTEEAAGRAADGRPTVPGRPRWLPVPALLSVSAVFHYLGPAFAVLLFSRVDVVGVAWLRIASAAAVFAVWRRPWRLFRSPPSAPPQTTAPTAIVPATTAPATAARPTAGGRRDLVALGVVLAVMNTAFYLAVARLPLSTVGAVEFLGVIALAAAGVRSRRNSLALALAVAGVLTLTDVRLAGEPLGFVFAFANCALFMLYVAIGHRVANAGSPDRPPDGSPWGGVDRLGAAMLVALVALTPFGAVPAAPAFTRPGLLAAGAAVGVCSSVVPYVTDQFAMAGLRRSTFALMLSVLPASATVVGALVLAQLPTARDVAGVALVVTAIAIHQPTSDRTMEGRS